MCSKVGAPGATPAGVHVSERAVCCAAPQLAAWNQEPVPGDGGVARPRERRHLRHALQGSPASSVLSSSGCRDKAAFPFYKPKSKETRPDKYTISSLEGECVCGKHGVCVCGGKFLSVSRPGGQC